MIKTFFEAESADNNSANQRLVLFVLLNNYRLNYAVFDEISNTFKSIKDFRLSDLPINSRLEFIASELNRISQKKSFKAINISVGNWKQALIPEQLFEHKKILSLFALHHEKLTVEQLAFDFLEENKCFNIYPLNISELNVIESIFPDAKLQHHSSVLLESYLILNNINELYPTELFVNLDVNFFEIAIYQEKKLVYFNIFEGVSGENILYFLSAICQQKNIQKNAAKIVFSGFTAEEDEIQHLLHKYFNHLYFAKSLPVVKHISIFDQIPAHTYYKLLNQNLCV